MVDRLGLKRIKHPTPYKVSWLHKGHKLLVNEQCNVEFQIGTYKDEILCDIMLDALNKIRNVNCVLLATVVGMAPFCL